MIGLAISYSAVAHLGDQVPCVPTGAAAPVIGLLDHGTNSFNTSAVDHHHPGRRALHSNFTSPKSVRFKL